MIPAFLITFVPTLLFYILLPLMGIRIKSRYLRISFAWFAGMYVFSFATFFLALLLSPRLSPVLTASVFGVLIAMTILLFIFAEELATLAKNGKEFLVKQNRFRPADVMLISSCLLFSFFFFSPHLTTTDNAIYRSPIYWDLHWHTAIIQNFVYGDNFPPENESFSGTPLTYHFFGDFVMSMYESVGLNFTDAITYTSILVLFFLLLAVIGCAEEFFHSKKAGAIAALLVVTSSSGRLLYDLASLQNHSIFEFVGNILNNTQSPWTVSFPSYPFGYSGIMFNLFFYLEERHMMFGLIYLLLCLWIIYKKKEFSDSMLFILGCFMGAFFFWHLYIPLMVLITLIVVLLFDKDKKQTFLLISGFSLLFGAQYILLKLIITHSPSFMASTPSLPQFNPTFAALSDDHRLKTLAIDSARYFAFAYGLKIIFLPISLLVIWYKNKRLGIILTGLIVPTFIAINTIQISPIDIGDNHKLLIPLNLVVSLTSAYGVYLLFFKKKLFYLSYIGIISLFLLTISGIIELMPFLNSKPTQLYADYAKESLTKTIRNNSSPKASFVGKDDTEIHLAGRKLFLGNSAGATKSFNKDVRKKIIKQIYKAGELTTFCQLTRTNKIDYVEFEPNKISLHNAFIKGLPHFEGKDWQKDTVIFVDTLQSCPNNL